MAKASAPKAAAKTKTETMSTRQLAAQLAENHELTNKAANAINIKMRLCERVFIE